MAIANARTFMGIYDNGKKKKPKIQNTEYNTSIKKVEIL
jgi:hypothetical protein